MGTADAAVTHSVNHAFCNVKSIQYNFERCRRLRWILMTDLGVRIEQNYVEYSAHLKKKIGINIRRDLREMQANVD